MFPIRITVNQDLKIVQFWLTAQEGEDNSIMEKIKNYADENTTAKKKTKRYKKVIYVSGVGDLVNLTADILKRNKKCSSA